MCQETDGTQVDGKSKPSEPRDETFLIIGGERYANGVIPSESVCTRR